MKADECSVAAIVVNWNGWRDTLECLESILRADRVPDSIIICDNGSMDGSLEHLRRWVAARGIGDRVALLDLGVNLGFAGANNVGIAYALERDADYVWMVNSDVVVGEKALSRMLALLWRNPRAGMVAPVFLSYDDPEKIQAMGGGYIIPVICHDTQLGRGRKQSGVLTSPIELHHLIGASLLVRADAARDVGPIDESYFLYREETDWCIRMRRRGWKLYCCPDAVVWHKECRCIGFRSPVHDYYAVRNMLVLVSRLYPMYLPAAALYFACRSIAPKLWRREFVRLKAVLAAYSDFFRGVRGRSESHPDSALLSQLVADSQDIPQRRLDGLGREGAHDFLCPDGEPLPLQPIVVEANDGVGKGVGAIGNEPAIAVSEDALGPHGGSHDGQAVRHGADDLSFHPGAEA